MKYILDVSVIVTMMQGHPSTKLNLGMRPRADVSIPHPVVVHMSGVIARLDAEAWPGALVHDRWEKARRFLLRCPWDEKVSDVLGELLRKYPAARELDRVVAAHALARGATVVTGTAGAAARFGRFSGLSLEHWGRDAGRGKKPDSP